MSININNSTCDYHRIIFRVKNQVEYGQTVGIKGSIDALGKWCDQSILPLTWNENHIWSGEILLSAEQFSSNSRFEYKFVVFTYCAGSNNKQVIEAENGANRQVNLNNTFLHPQNNNKVYEVEEIFNKRKITFGVSSTAASFSAASPTQIQVTGNIQQLRVPQTLALANSADGRSSNIFRNDFYIDMREDVLRYHYIQNTTQFERGIGRYLLFNSSISKPFAIQYSDYQPDVFRGELSYDQITENLWVGAFLNSESDIEQLQEKGITAIINLQTQRDMQRKFVDVEQIKKICKSHKILYINYAIRDNDPFDYIQKASDVLEIIEDLYNDNHSIYIHCTAGIGRAPQTAILHLVLHQKISLEEASLLLFTKRPICSPNREAICTVLKALQENQFECASDGSSYESNQFNNSVEVAIHY